MNMMAILNNVTLKCHLDLLQSQGTKVVSKLEEEHLRETACLACSEVLLAEENITIATFKSKHPMSHWDTCLPLPLQDDHATCLC